MKSDTGPFRGARLAVRGPRDAPPDLRDVALASSGYGPWAARLNEQHTLDVMAWTGIGFLCRLRGPRQLGPGGSAHGAVDGSAAVKVTRPSLKRVKPIISRYIVATGFALYKVERISVGVSVYCSHVLKLESPSCCYFNYSVATNFNNCNIQFTSISALRNAQCCRTNILFCCCLSSLKTITLYDCFQAKRFADPIHHFQILAPNFPFFVTAWEKVVNNLILGTSVHPCTPGLRQIRAGGPQLPHHPKIETHVLNEQH